MIFGWSKSNSTSSLLNVLTTSSALTTTPSYILWYQLLVALLVVGCCSERWSLSVRFKSNCSAPTQCWVLYALIVSNIWVRNAVALKIGLLKEQCQKIDIISLHWLQKNVVTTWNLYIAPVGIKWKLKRLTQPAKAWLSDWSGGIRLNWLSTGPLPSFYSWEDN